LGRPPGLAAVFTISGGTALTRAAVVDVVRDATYRPES
jgi:hypothetical protein